MRTGLASRRPGGAGAMSREPLEYLTQHVPRLETPRLVLRAWTQDDVAPYQRLVRDVEVMRYMGSGPVWSAKRAVAALVARVSDIESRRSLRHVAEHWKSHGFGEWAVEERASGELIGRIGLRHHGDWVADAVKVEIGWLLARRAWGAGYATEGARAGIDHAFGPLELGRLMSIALVGNRRSQRVMEKLGLTRRGRTRWKGSEVVWYGIERDRWSRA
jgi:RimJ/RimL family protein N-acetyltransferase